MALFSSTREKRLWLWTLAVLVAIYSTLGLAGSLAQELNELNKRAVEGAVFTSFVGAIVAGMLIVLLNRRSGWREIGVVLAVAVVYLAAVLRMFVSSADRTHLFEYSLVALLIHRALTERQDQGRRVPAPAALAVILTALAGWLDEGIQGLIPNRVYELRDVAFNTLAATMAILSSVAVGLARRRDRAAEQTEVQLSWRTRAGWVGVAACLVLGSTLMPFALEMGSPELAATTMLYRGGLVEGLPNKARAEKQVGPFGHPWRFREQAEAPNPDADPRAARWGIYSVGRNGVDDRGLGDDVWPYPDPSAHPECRFLAWSSEGFLLLALALASLVAHRWWRASGRQAS